DVCSSDLLPLHVHFLLDEWLAILRQIVPSLFCRTGVAPGSDDPFRILELAQRPNLAERRCTPDDGRHVRIVLTFHGIALLLAVPAGNGDERHRITDLAMQLGAPGPRCTLNDLARPYPGVGILFGSVALFYAHLEDEFHVPLQNLGRYSYSV